MSDSVENEWLCLRIASAFGLLVPEAELREFEDVRVLVVERFDRRWSKDRTWILRLPQEDMCQALGISPGRKYESEGGPGIADILDLLLQSQDPEADRSMFFRAQIVFWLLAAIDGHAKNFSLFLHAGGRCRLTPVYDILSAYPVMARRQLHPKDVRMAMAVRGKNRDYRRYEAQGRHWLTTARSARFSERQASEILEDCLSRAPEVIDSVSRALPPDFPEDVSTPIFEGITGRVKSS